MTTRLRRAFLFIALSVIIPVGLFVSLATGTTPTDGSISASWDPLDKVTSIHGQATWLFRSSPNLSAAPVFGAPSGWEVLFPPTNGGVAGGRRFYAALRQIKATNPATKGGAPSIKNWSSFSAPTSDASVAVWGYRSAPDLKVSPPLTAPAGWQVIVPATYGGIPGGARYYCAIRQLTNVAVPATPAAPVVNPVTPTPPAQPTVGAAYVIDASETLHVSSTAADATGALKLRTWTFMGQTQTGYNAAFWVPNTTPVGTQTLQEFDAWTTSNETVHSVTINADPYKEVVLPSGGDLHAAIDSAANLTRVVLPAGSSYTITQTAYVPQRVQVVAGGAGVTVRINPPIPAGLTTWPAFYFLWNDAVSAQLTVTGVNFTGPSTMRLDASIKTGLTAAYAPLGMLTMVDCSFSKLDQGVQLDSRPSYECDGVLFLNCNANDGTMCGCPIWGAGQHIVVEGCKLGPSTQEHPLRFSIVNLTTNQIPQFIRIGNSTLTAVKQSTLAKECLALRDCRYVCVDNVDGNNWAECGQGSVNTWDVAERITINNLRLSFDTLHLRLGTTGPVLVQKSSFKASPVVGVPAGVAVTLSGNAP